MSYVIADSNGEIRLSVTGQSEPPAGAVPGFGRAATHWVCEGQLVEYTPEQSAAKADRPMWRCRWSNEYMAYLDLRTLDEVRADKVAAINAEVERLGDLPIAYRGALFDADARAQRNVMFWQGQLANGAALPTGFVWRDAANVDHPADAEFVNGLGLAMALRGTALYQAAWAAKGAVAVATTTSEVQAVDLQAAGF